MVVVSSRMQTFNHGSNRVLQLLDNCQDQNGMAECGIQTINNMIHCMLIQSGLPISFWVEAVFYTTFIHNSFPRANLNYLMPMEVIFKKCPNHNMVHTFWCEAWRHFSDSKRCAYDPKAEWCIFLGIQQDYMAF